MDMDRYAGIQIETRQIEMWEDGQMISIQMDEQIDGYMWIDRYGGRQMDTWEVGYIDRWIYIWEMDRELERYE